MRRRMRTTYGMDTQYSEFLRVSYQQLLGMAAAAISFSTHIFSNTSYADRQIILHKYV